MELESENAVLYLIMNVVVPICLALLIPTGMQALVTWIFNPKPNLPVSGWGRVVIELFWLELVTFDLIIAYAIWREGILYRAVTLSIAVFVIAFRLWQNQLNRKIIAKSRATCD